MRVSREQDGAYEVWLDGVKVYSKIGINVGFGTWDGDKLTTRWYFKNGMYAYGESLIQTWESQRFSFRLTDV